MGQSCYAPVIYTIIVLLQPASLLQAAPATLWADCELAGRNPEKSIVACTRVLEGGPASRRAEAFHNRGVALAEKGDLDKAISDISEGISLDPSRAYRFEERGEVYLKKGDFRRAIVDLNRAIQIDPTPRAFRFQARADAL